MNSSQAELRAQMRRIGRRARRQLPPADRRRHAAAVARALLAHRALRPGKRIAVYWPVASELDTRPLLRALRARGCRVYLPQIGPGRSHRMRFIAWAGQELKRNAYDIPEPDRGKASVTAFLDWVLLPLVAFDGAGHRLGSGAGYYDRALAFRLRRRHWHGPRLVGLAFAAQELAAIPSQPHDVGLDAVVTERGYRRFAR